MINNKPSYTFKMIYLYIGLIISFSGAQATEKYLSDEANDKIIKNYGSIHPNTDRKEEIRKRLIENYLNSPKLDVPYKGVCKNSEFYEGYAEIE